MLCVDSLCVLFLSLHNSYQFVLSHALLTRTHQLQTLISSSTDTRTTAAHIAVDINVLQTRSHAHGKKKKSNCPEVGEPMCFLYACIWSAEKDLMGMGTNLACTGNN